MNERLTAEIERIRSDKSIPTLDEDNVKRVAIEPILRELGWNIYDTKEFRSEYNVSGGKVDYSLRLENMTKVFLEAKKPREELGKHQRQLLEYAFEMGVSLAVLTNGLTWWFYLPLQERSWEERRFSVIELRNPDVSQTTGRLMDFLSRENVHNGVAVGLAEGNLYRLWQDKKIKEVLPKVWDQIITDPDDQLLALLNQKVMKMCGFGVDLDQIKRFLAGLPKPASTLPVSTLLHTTSQPSVREPATQYRRKSKSPSPESITFLGERFEVRYWSDVLVRLGEAVYK